MKFTYKIADVVFNADIKYKYTYGVMENFLAPNGEKAEFDIEVTKMDLKNEKSLSPHDMPDCYHESVALYRKFIYILLKSYDAFFFHCSAIAVDNKAIMFTAKSGTGKSTHRRLWEKNFKERVIVINDDKPIIRKVNGVYYVYGTPWQGKEGLGCNIRVPAKALCFLSRGDTNSIGSISTSQVVSKMLNQVVRPSDPKLMSNFLQLLDEFLQQVDTYDLRVNMTDAAALTAYDGIFSQNK